MGSRDARDDCHRSARSGSNVSVNNVRSENCQVQAEHHRQQRQLQISKITTQLHLCTYYIRGFNFLKLRIYLNLKYI